MTISEQRDSRGRFLPFYIPRDEMPQIDEENYPDLLAWLDNKSIRHAPDLIDARLLNVHQARDSFRASHFLSDHLTKPVLISADNYILDGHHRVAAHIANNTDCPVIQIDLPFINALVALFAFPASYQLIETEAD